MTGAARLENLRIPLVADGREICLLFLSKGYCIRSYTLSHVHVRGHNRDLVIRYIRFAREVMYPSRKRKFYDGENQGYHGGNWDRRGGHGPKKSEG